MIANDPEVKFLLERREYLKRNLPHIYGHKLYTWQREYLDTMNKIALIVACNQGGKSSIQIMRCIYFATDRKLWKKLWNRDPRVFWYMYPNHNTAYEEWKDKWSIYMPKGELKHDPYWGWVEDIVKTNKGPKIDAVHFNSGVTVYFKNYTQDPKNLQAATLDAVFGDEEMPLGHFNEVINRLAATDGYYSNVFTATLGQMYLLQAFHERYVGTKKERFKDAFKREISRYDCLLYEDGSPSTVWTKEKIDKQAAALTSESERAKRIHGKFILEKSDLLFSGFSETESTCEFHSLPMDWNVYAGIDYGSGGEAHPPAIAFVGVDPQFQHALIFRVWKGDDGQKYTAGTIVDKYVELSQGLNIVGAYYDYACADIGTIAEGRRIPMYRANKARDGIELVNSAFKTGQLKVMLPSSNGITDMDKLVAELTTLKPGEKKHDDLCDALRYAFIQIPLIYSETEFGGKKKIIDKPEIYSHPRGAELAKLGIDTEYGRVFEEYDEVDYWSELLEEVHSL